ncbi:hypothetical protein K503DRAFT_804638 [Rhizopogon vinicolor AM-OR11-026]|uniref:DUF6533 domain-containing protein n=1 Tax=Rhizopogon vinicolor AM-OR11-026 TaxID=1314800 RepID=A0A1B7MKL7_9AGAM|nr:hypothetical protein K503DRAFT_804638 [Rhizopogon vinicolor AM-OR11-026]
MGNNKIGPSGLHSVIYTARRCGDISSQNATLKPRSLPLTDTMTIVSDDPSFWPLIGYFRGYSYFTVAATTALVYDWALTLGKETELIWGQRWSVMTILYLCVRYLGIPYSAIYTIESVTTVSVADTVRVSTTLYFVSSWTSMSINGVLGVIMITRLYAMYQRSKMILTFLVVAFLITIINGIVTASIERYHMSAEEAILSGTHVCTYSYNGAAILIAESWILSTVWEVFALCLAIWIVVKHFRELPRQQSTGRAVVDVFAVLMQSHVFYFVGFAAVSCFILGILSPKIAGSISLGTEFYDGILQIAEIMQVSVLGPRLILSVREYNADLVANSDEGIAMTTIAFGEHILQESSGGDV